MGKLRSDPPFPKQDCFLSCSTINGFDSSDRAVIFYFNPGCANLERIIKSIAFDLFVITVLLKQRIQSIDQKGKIFNNKIF